MVDGMNFARIWFRSFWFYQCFALRLLGYSIRQALLGDVR